MDSEWAPRISQVRYSNLSAVSSASDISHTTSTNDAVSTASSSQKQLESLESLRYADACLETSAHGNVFLVEINDQNQCGMASACSIERSITEEIHESFRSHLVKDVFPFMKPDFWEDKYHFNKIGFDAFASAFARNMKSFFL